MKAHHVFEWMHLPKRNCRRMPEKLINGGPGLWCTPVIPATQEREIWRIMIQAHPGQNVSETLSQPVSWAWWCMLVIPATKKA
jgi:hypothetical protein